ncbi:MAG: hypothetical protein AAB921_01960 [Patescibacteria group bacterium]
MEQEAPVAFEGISSPTEVFGPLLAQINVPATISVIAWILFAIWLIYTVVASYHLLRYGHSTTVAVPAIITHVFVSVVLALFIVSGLT